MVSNSNQLPLEEFKLFKAKHKFSDYVDYVDVDPEFEKFYDNLKPVESKTIKKALKLYEEKTGIKVQLKSRYDIFLQEEGRKFRNLIQIPDPAYDGYSELQNLTSRIIKRGHYPSIKGFIASLEVNLDWVKQDIESFPVSQFFRQYDRLEGEIEKSAAALLIEESKVSQILHRHTTVSISDTIQLINSECKRPPFSVNLKV